MTDRRFRFTSGGPRIPSTAVTTGDSTEARRSVSGTARRPTSVTVVVGLLLALTVVSGALLPFFWSESAVADLARHSAIPVGVHLGWSIVYTAVLLVSAFGMLRGRDWARWLYVVSSVVGTLEAFAVAQYYAMQMPGVVLLMLSFFVLFRPAANRYFARGFT